MENQTNKEKRKHFRGDIYYLVKYKTGTKKGIVSSINISAGGALLRLREELKVGDPIDISINFLDHPDRRVSLVAKIVRVKKYKKYYKTAIEFKKINLSDKESIDHFLKGIF